MRRRFILFFAFIFAPVVAQLSYPEPEPAVAAPEAWLVPFACAYQPDIAEFNRRFASYGIPAASLRHYGWGVEIRSVVGNNFLVGPMLFRTRDVVANETIQLRTETNAIFALAGWKLPLFRFLTIVPIVGLGGVQPVFQITEKTGDIPLESLLTAPGKIATLSPGFKPTGIAALELNLLVPTGSGNYGISLRGGYLYSPFPLNWRLPSGARVTSTPDTKIRGPWFSAGITLIPAAEVTRVQ